MQEKEVTIAGEHRPLGRPFHVLATQNPIEQEGTYPLPEAQLDRFLVQVDVAYPTRADRTRHPDRHHRGRGGRGHQVFSAEALIAAQSVVRRMPVGDKVVEAILDLVRACRPGNPRAAISPTAWPGAPARARRRR
jgi:MoxR-like ATPase